MIDNLTLQVIKRRRSIRAYRPEQVSADEVRAVVEAGLYAPHAGDQDWHFTVVQNWELLQRLNLVAKEAARGSGLEWLQRLGNDPTFDCLYGAPTLVIVSGNGQSPIPLDSDCAAATENLLLAAESVGLGSCWIYFILLAFQSSQAAGLRQELQIPEGYRPYTSVALGYKQAEGEPVPARKPGLVTYIR